MVTIHGGEWKLADVVDDVREFRTLTWRAETWRRGPALVHRSGGRVSFYHGQRFDPEKIDLVADGWSHDHCLICCYRISDDDGLRDAFTDGHERWLCAECHEQFIRGDAAGIEGPENAAREGQQR